jgi:3-deoxy-D-arabino-heptulosonate 7-phosphate (DAHP) synthase
MTVFAPESPNLAELEQAHPLTEATLEAIGTARASSILSGASPGLLAILGPCAMTEDRQTIDQEGDRISALDFPEVGLITLHRQPVWKPRTNAADWHGLETTNPRAAHGTLFGRAAAAANVAIEIGHSPHLHRYGRALTLGWIGSRNAEDTELLEAVASHDPTLPIGIKNGMNGSIDKALENVDRITELRGNDTGAVGLIFRGGTDIQTSQEWEHAYREALERTNGLLIVDTAHGGEMAHDLNGTYEKSVAGQVACMDHVVRIAEKGELPAGIMIEASDAVSPTDPVMPFVLALDGIVQLEVARRGMH